MVERVSRELRNKKSLNHLSGIVDGRDQAADAGFSVTPLGDSKRVVA